VKIILILLLVVGSPAFAKESKGSGYEEVAADAETAWRQGASSKALEILEEGIHAFPQAWSLRKLRGDILATIREHDEALAAYEDALALAPNAQEIRWAKWSVLVRLGQGNLAIAELQRISKEDDRNPLVFLRLAQELRNLDRLEESVEAYRKAVELAPDLPSWRLALARALFDVLKYDEARKEIESVMRTVPQGSPAEASARNLLMIVYGATKERGRRFQAILSPEGTSADRKAWALVRHKAWKLYANGQFREAEPVLREVLMHRPSDYRATYELGRTLMELGQYEEAIEYLQKGIDLSPSGGIYNEIFLDSIFQIGQALVFLERWQEALLHFQILQEVGRETQGIDVEESNDAETEAIEENPDDPDPIPGIPLLDLEKVAMWIEKVLPHIPAEERAFGESMASASPQESSGSPTTSEDEFDPVPPKSFEPVYARTSLMGRDADFSWFRFVIPSQKVMRDDLLMGAHEYIPIDPGNSFDSSLTDLYLVFALVTPSYDDVPLTAECFLETSKVKAQQTALARDQVVMSMNEQFGYFRLASPSSGWIPGLYRCGLFVGDEVSAYNLADEVRFRIEGSSG
jgi:tetratricopeptide (TPR) repeat protein